MRPQTTRSYYGCHLNASNVVADVAVATDVAADVVVATDIVVAATYCSYCYCCCGVVVNGSIEALFLVHTE